MKKIFLFVFLIALVIGSSAQDKKPNILVIWGDDIGTWNISHNNRGMMGYQTPNIDELQKKVLRLRIITRSKVVLQDGLHLLVDLFRCAQE